MRVQCSSKCDSVLGTDWTATMYLFRRRNAVSVRSSPTFAQKRLLRYACLRLAQPDVFESCLRARDDGLAGIDFIPEPYYSEKIGRGPTRVPIELPKRDWASRPCGGILNRQHRRSSETPGYQTDRPRRARGGDRRTTTSSSGLRCHRRVLPYLECNLGAVPSLGEHPIRLLVEAGVPVTLSTDDPVRLCTTIEREYELAAALNFGVDDLLSFTRQAILASFTSDERRSELLDVVERWSVPTSRPIGDQDRDNAAAAG